MREIPIFVSFVIVQSHPNFEWNSTMTVKQNNKNCPQNMIWCYLNHSGFRENWSDTEFWYIINSADRPKGLFCFCSMYAGCIIFRSRWLVYEIRCEGFWTPNEGDERHDTFLPHSYTYFQPFRSRDRNNHSAFAILSLRCLTFCNFSGY